MLLFKKPFFAGLQSGAITLTFRRWQKPHVRPGGRYRCHPIGVLEVDCGIQDFMQGRFDMRCSEQTISELVQEHHVGASALRGRIGRVRERCRLLLRSLGSRNVDRHTNLHFLLTAFAELVKATG